MSVFTWLKRFRSGGALSNRSLRPRRTRAIFLESLELRQVLAAAGDLDTSFSGDGKVTTELFAASIESAYATVIQPDGKIIAVGGNTTGTPAVVAARYTTAGALDTTFDSDGRVLTTIASGGGIASAVALQSDGKIVIAGQSSNGVHDDFLVARYNAGGSLDTTFDGDGILNTDFSAGHDRAYGIVIQSDGKIVVAGSSASGGVDRFALARYNADGTLDTTFDTDGKVTTSLGAEGAVIRALALQADGKFVAAGSSTAAGNADFAVARYNSDGSLDAAFDTDGIATAELGGQDFIRGTALQTDGKIVVAGSSTAGGAADFALARFQTNGALDATFDGDGKLITNYWTGADAANAVTIQSDGKIIAAGYQTSGSNADFAYARFLSTGGVDTSFGSSGKTSMSQGVDAVYGVALQADGLLVSVGDTTMLTGKDFFVHRFQANASGTDFITYTSDFRPSQDSARGVVVQSDDKIVVAGSGNLGTGTGDFAVVRYRTDGVGDATFGRSGVVLTDFGGDDFAKDLALQPDGKIIVVGESTIAGVRNFAVARYRTDGALDTTFDGDGKVLTPSDGGLASAAYATFVSSNGKIVVAGQGTGGVNSDMFITRYLPSGALDTSFSGDGKIAIDIAGNDLANGVAEAPDGKIVAAGWAAVDASHFDFGVVRLNVDGTLDTTFDGDGKLALDMGTFGDVATDVAVQSDGKILVLGQAGSTIQVVRLNLNGSVDTSFGDSGIATVATGVPNHMTVDLNGRIIVAANAGGGLFVARLNSNGVLDTTFSGDGMQIETFGGSGSGTDVAIQSEGKIVAAGRDNGGAGGSDIGVVRYLGHDGSLFALRDPSLGNVQVSGGTKVNQLTVDRTGNQLTFTDNGDRFQTAIGGTLSNDYHTFSFDTVANPYASMYLAFSGAGDVLTINTDLSFTDPSAPNFTADTIQFGPGVDITTTGFAVSAFTADNIAVDPTATLALTGILQIFSGSTGRNFSFGAETPGSLSLSDAELDRITAGNIYCNTSGALTIAGDVTHSGSTNFQVVAGGGVVISGGVFDAGTGTVHLDSGASGGLIRPIKAGLDARGSAVRTSGKLGIAIDGSTLDTGYTQYKIEGSFQITTASLVLSGSYVPQIGDRFVIVDNDGADAVSGRFTGLAEGATVTFNGVPLTITYFGGTGGNDVELVRVAPTTPYVTATTPTTSGARITLSKAIDISTLNLYDYRDGGGNFVLGAADVTLVGASGGAIPGSLILEPGDTAFTFVATSGVLPADNYTLTLRSATNGIRTATGELLDGNADGTAGDNFVTTFVVSPPPANAIVVGLPNFARGPEQPVNVPASPALGLPIQVSDGGGLTALNFELRFDTGLLDVTAVSLVGGGTANLTPVSPGRVQVALTFAAPLASGAQTVAYLTATVPTSAASRYGERETLDISALSLTAGGSVPGIDRDAVHVNAYFADLGRNGKYDSFDVQQASRMALRLDTGFQQHPLLDPTILADVNGNGRVDSFDVQQISRLALRLPVTAAPALPSPAPPTTDTDRIVVDPPPEEKEKSTTPRADVDGNGAVDAQDVAWAIYYFNRSANETSKEEQARLDVNRDESFDAADVLVTINDFNAASQDALAALLAADAVAAKKKNAVE